MFFSLFLNFCAWRGCAPGLLFSRSIVFPALRQLCTAIHSACLSRCVYPGTSIHADSVGAMSRCVPVVPVTRTNGFKPGCRLLWRVYLAIQGTWSLFLCILHKHKGRKLCILYEVKEPLPAPLPPAIFPDFSLSPRLFLQTPFFQFPFASGSGFSKALCGILNPLPCQGKVRW